MRMSDGYDVDCAELHHGSSWLLRVFDGVEDHGMGDAAGDGGQYGHALLHQAVASFCTVINAGVAALRADLEATSSGLTATALSYSDSEVSARDLVVGADG
jgi:hypothetical protein